MKIVLSALIAYVLGSASFSIVLSKLMYRKDVREEGSGNAGTTNMIRVMGLKAGMITFLLVFVAYYMVTLLHHAIFFSRVSKRL